MPRLLETGWANFASLLLTKVFPVAGRLQVLRDSRKQLGHGIRNDDSAVSTFKFRDQTNLPSRASHLIPREPNAVGVPQLALTIVSRQLIGRDHELFLGSHTLRLPFFCVKREHQQRAIHFDGLIASLIVEDDSSAKATNSWLIFLMEYGVAPDGQHFAGNGRLVILQPWKLASQIESSAARRQN